MKNYYEYKIIVKNFNKAFEEQTLYDRIPHSSSENIKVDIEHIAPKSNKKELGVLKWKLNMKEVQDKT